MNSDLKTIRLKRLLYQSNHRGTKEADIIIGGFAERFIEKLSESELDDFENLLSVSDPDLMNWLSGFTTPDSTYQTSLWDKIMEFKTKRSITD